MLELLVLVKVLLLTFYLRDGFLERVYNFISRDHLLLHLLALLFYLIDFLPHFIDFLEDGARLLYLLNLFD